MPHLIGDHVKRRMAAHGYGFVSQIAQETGLNYPHLRAAITRRRHAHPINLAAIYTLAEALRDEGETVEDVVADIVAGDGTPDPPPEKKTKDTTGTPRRKDSEEKRTGPKREQSSGRVA